MKKIYIGICLILIGIFLVTKIWNKNSTNVEMSENPPLPNQLSTQLEGNKNKVESSVLSNNQTIKKSLSDKEVSAENGTKKISDKDISNMAENKKFSEEERKNLMYNKPPVPEGFK